MQILAIPDLRGEHLKESVNGTVALRLALEDHNYKSVLVGWPFWGCGRRGWIPRITYLNIRP
jgi:hypothetical protein